MIECGASSLISMKRLGIDRNRIRSILFTHFHADHFGGLPFFLLDSQFFSKRTETLVIAGPHGLRNRFLQVMEAAFPGSSKTEQGFELVLRELQGDEPAEIDDICVTPYLVNQGNPGGPFLTLRIEVEDRIIAYTGDTEWTGSIIRAATNADLFVAEAYFADKPVPLHLDLATLEKHLPAIGAKRVILTHMSDEMLSRRSDIGHETAEDGLIVQF